MPLDLLENDPFVVAFELNNKQLQQAVQIFSHDNENLGND
jgi:hypothetical protein